MTEETAGSACCPDGDCPWEAMGHPEVCAPDAPAAAAAALREWLDGFVGSEEERAVADALLEVIDAAREMQRTSGGKGEGDAWVRLSAALRGLDEHV